MIKEIKPTKEQLHAVLVKGETIVVVPAIPATEAIVFQYPYYTRIYLN